jgi:ATP-dependent Clp protease adaptor protein ClpS
MDAGTWSLLQPGGYKPDLVVEDVARSDPRRKVPAEVWLHNDDYTPAEYVVRVLQEVFVLGFWKANWVMVKAHSTGDALVGTYPRQEAEEKVEAAEQRARGDGWPLRLSVREPE